ncbi:hypothetical protein NPIL_308701 [Nephila pilipes]|uniref:Uncharacterized protein n=1 Tax=Nephila pilipes TaxID=299642 RepID=A0A8X6T7P8_NEPPI|nr:hypothetical protein NPIL_308701 [Nephila pilipes]
MSAKESDVNWVAFSRDTKLSEDIIRNLQHKLDWLAISRYQSLSEAFLIEFKEKVNWDLVCEHQKLSENFMRRGFQGLFQMNASLISQHQHLSQSFMLEFKSYLDWSKISRYQPLDESFIINNIHLLDLKLISRYQNMSESTMNILEDTLDWDEIFKTKELSGAFISKHIDKISSCDSLSCKNLHEVVINTIFKRQVLMYLSVKINASFDTGSELSMISYESYISIGYPKLSFNNVSFAGINQECLSPLGFFYSDIKFDKCCIATEIYVIQKLCCDFIIGLDVISKLNITINENGFEIAGKRNTFHASYATINFNRVPTHKTSPNNIKHITSVFRLAACVGSEANANNEVNVQPVVTINPNAVHTSGKTADVEEIEYFFNLAKAINLDEVDLTHISDQDIKHNLKQVLDTYTPQKRKTTDVMMKIVLNDESPIHSKPRR